MKYFILFILFLFQSLFSQINWTSVYGDTLSLDEGWYISKTNDGNYIVSGMEHYTAVIKKINSSGELIWSKTYDNPTESDGYVGDDVIKSVRQVSDGGYIAAGYFEDEDSWSRVSWIFKTDESGEVLWSKTYTKNNSTDTWAEDVIETTDGGFVITGNNKNNGDRAQAMLRKYDDNGELVWHKTYSRSNYNEGISLIETNEGDIVFVGFSGTSHGAYKHFIVKTDSEGNSLFKKRFGTNTQQSLNSVIEALGGGYIAIGYCNNYNDLYIVKFDTGGSILWEHCIPANQDNFYGWDHGNDIIHAQSGGYYIVGTSSTYPESNGGDDIYLVKIDDLQRGSSIDKPSQSATAMVQGMELFIPLADLIDIDDEIKRLEKQISDMNGRLGAVNGKLSNANFVDRAPNDVVDNEKRKQAEYQSSLDKLQDNLKSLKA